MASNSSEYDLIILAILASWTDVQSNNLKMYTGMANGN